MIRKYWPSAIIISLIFGGIILLKIQSDDKTEAINQCSKKVKGVLTKLTPRKRLAGYFNYEYYVDGVKYSATQNAKGVLQNKSVGDSVTIEFGFEDISTSRVSE